MDYTNIIISPIISEKSMDDVSKTKFTFRVNKGASKGQIKLAIEGKFKVNVIEIKTLNMKGKTKRFGQKRIETKTSGFKKAIVVLKSGQKIDLFEAGTA
jgi:large subunit ribosomal protein L23